MWNHSSANALPMATRGKHFLPDVFVNNETTVVKIQSILYFDREMLYPTNVTMLNRDRMSKNGNT